MSKDPNKKLSDIASDKLKKSDSSAPYIGPALETDPAQNAVADKIIDILVGDAESPDEDAYYGIPDDMLKAAGKALANRYCFAVCVEEEEYADEPLVMVTPIRYFEENGCCDDQSGPISDLLPRCAEAMESTWEIYHDSVNSPETAAAYLQSLGFVWNKDFQEFIDNKWTDKIEQSLTEAAQAGSQNTKGVKPPKP